MTRPTSDGTSTDARPAVSDDAFRWPLSVVLAVLLGASVALNLALGSVAPMALVVLTTLVLAHRGSLGWRLAFALSILGAFVGQVLVSWAAPHVGGSYATDTLVFWTAVALTHAVLAGRPVPEPSRWSRARARDLAAALVVPGGLVVYFGLSARQPGVFISWAMASDAANYALLTRWTLEDGGLLRSQGNAAPLATVLHATWTAPGADGLGAPALIRHVITSSALLSSAGWLLLSFLASVLVLGSARGRTGARVCVAIVAGLLPWAWFASGVALFYGFANAFPAIMVLVLGWFCWDAHARRPVASLTGQVLAIWAAAVAWGPTAIVPAGWLLATVVVERRALLRAGRRLWWPAATLVGAATYAVVVTGHDVSSTGSALAADGSIPVVDRWWVAGTFAVVLLASLLPGTGMSRTVRLGIWAGVPAAALGAAYLIRARADQPEWWGYYPVKFSWILLCALCLIAVASLQHPARRLARRGWQGNGALLAGGALLLAMAQISAPSRPLTLTAVATPVLMHDHRTNDALLPSMFDRMDRNPKSIVARFSAADEQDRFLNYWTLQMGAEDLADPIRVQAYFMDPSMPLSICTAINDWGGDVTVWTRDPKLVKQLARTCDPSLDYSVKVLPPLPTP